MGVAGSRNISKTGESAWRSTRPIDTPALELLRKVEAELAAIKKLNDEDAVRRRIDALNVEIRKVNATAIEGPPTRLELLDVEEVIAEWRRARQA